MSTVQILNGDALDMLRTLPSESVHCCVTSPPYFGLRDYQHERQIGRESTPDEYTKSLVSVFREVRRVLRNDATCWLNLGDSYAGSGKGQTGHNGIGNQEKRQGFITCKPKDRSVSRWGGGNGSVSGVKPKDLIGIPWTVAFALRDDGWWLRSDIIWSKGNPMPESVEDRPTGSHEYLFLLSKSATYYYDATAIAEPTVTFDSSLRDRDATRLNNTPGRTRMGGLQTNDYQTRNKRSVWTVNTLAYSGAHFATFPPKLIKPCILAGTSEKGCCADCGAPWERIVENEAINRTRVVGIGIDSDRGTRGRAGEQVRTTTGWRVVCKHNADVIPCTVLDPFAGSGTVGEVAQKFGRNAILIELNPDYIPLIRERCVDPAPLFNLSDPSPVAGG